MEAIGNIFLPLGENDHGQAFKLPRRGNEKVRLEMRENGRLGTAMRRDLRMGEYPWNGTKRESTDSSKSM
jgi:hypothetical protein